MDFRFRFNKQGDIKSDVTRQLMEFVGNLYELGRSKGIYPNEEEDETLADALAEEMQIINECTAIFEADKDPGREDVRLSTLIGYANAFGGIVRIQIEFDNGEKTELL